MTDGQSLLLVLHDNLGSERRKNKRLVVESKFSLTIQNMKKVHGLISILF